MSELLTLWTRAALLGVETRGYTEPERVMLLPTVHACTGSDTWLERLHWAAIHCVGVTKATNACSTVGMSGRATLSSEDWLGKGELLLILFYGGNYTNYIL